MPRTRALLLGDSSNRDLADQVAFLERSCDVEYEQEIATACRRLCADAVDLVVVAVASPGERPHDELNALRAAAPFTPILMLLGTWCEGEERTGKPWPSAIRLYAHQFIPRVAAQLATELDRSEQGFECWSPPFTQTHEDRLLRDATLFQSSSRLSVAIQATSSTAARALTDALEISGFAPVTLRHDGRLQQREFNAIVWDCGAGLDQDVPLLSAMRADSGDTPIVVVLGFPRPGDYDLASDLNVAAIVSKPFLLDDLVCTVRRAAATKKSVSQAAAEMI